MNITSLEIAQATMDMFFCLFCLIMTWIQREMERHLNKKARRGSHKNHIKGCTMSSGHRFCTDRSGNGDTRKRIDEDDVRFVQSFEKLILMAKSKEGDQNGTV